MMMTNNGLACCAVLRNPCGDLDWLLQDTSSGQVGLRLFFPVHISHSISNGEGANIPGVQSKLRYPEPPSILVEFGQDGWQHDLGREILLHGSDLLSMRKQERGQAHLERRLFAQYGVQTDPSQFGGNSAQDHRLKKKSRALKGILGAGLFDHHIISHRVHDVDGKPEPCPLAT